MFTLFTGSNFGRGFELSNTGSQNLASYLEAYRRNRAKIRRQAALLDSPIARAA
jgi:hypothetical protein